MSDNDEVSFPKKLKDLLGPFVEEADAMSNEDLKKVIIASESALSKNDKDKAEDVKLAAFKEKVKEHSLQYREVAKYQTAKIKYAVFSLENRGVDLGSKDSD